MSYYLCRIGENSKYRGEAVKSGFIAIGWKEVPDLRTLKTTTDIKAAFDKAKYGYFPVQAGQLYRFGHDMQPGDIAMLPMESGEYLVAQIGPIPINWRFEHYSEVCVECDSNDLWGGGKWSILTLLCL